MASLSPENGKHAMEMKSEEQLQNQPNAQHTNDNSDAVLNAVINTVNEAVNVNTPEPPYKAPKKPRTENSWVWNWFKRVYRKDKPDNYYYDPRSGVRKLERDIFCQHIDCQWSTQESRRAGSTSNMSLHLRRKHHITSDTPFDETRIHNNVGQHNSEGYADGSILDPNAARLQRESSRSHLQAMEQLQKDVVRFAATTLQPVSAVVGRDFLDMIKKFSGEPPFDSESSYKRRLEDEFRKYRNELKRDLADSCQTIALSLDLWTSQSSPPILAVVGHWISGDFKLKERILEFSHLQVLPTSQNISECIYKMLVDLSLEGKVLSITASNAVQNASLCKDLSKRLSQRLEAVDIPISMPFRGEHSLAQSLSQLINLVVDQFLRSLACNDTNSAAEYFERLVGDQVTLDKELTGLSVIARLKLVALYTAAGETDIKEQWKISCQEAGLPERFIDCQVGNQWNSIALLLDQCVEVKGPIDSFLKNHKIIPAFNSEEWTFIQQVQKALHRFNDIATVVFKTCPQLSLAFRVYYALFEHLNEIQNGTKGFEGVLNSVSEAAKQATTKYNNCYTYGQETSNYCLSTVVDPRIKATYYLRDHSKAETEAFINRLREYLYLQYPSVNPEHADERDIDEYFNVAKIQMPKLSTKDAEISILSWWDSKKHQYPRMSQVARDFLAIPASEVKIDRLIPDGIAPDSLQHDPDTMRMLTLLRDHYLA